MGYTLTFGHATTNFTDSNSTFFGNIPDIAATTTAANVPKVYVPKAGTIKSIMGGAIVGSTIGSAETGRIYLQVNEVNKISGSITYNNADRWNSILMTGLNIPVVATDRLNFFLESPAWATNPTAVRHSLNVYIE